MLKKLGTPNKVDAVVDAAHFGPNGDLLWLRVYERRGPTWSDLVLLDRQSLIKRLEAGKRFFVGKRRDFRASEFDLGERIHLQGKKAARILVIGKGPSHQDRLAALPIV